MRALEIVEARGTLSARRREGATRPSVRIGLDVAADRHRRWVTERAQAMFRAGLVEETRAALRDGVTAEVLDGCGIGYREALDVLAGRASEAGEPGRVAIASSSLANCVSEAGPMPMPGRPPIRSVGT